MDVMKRWFNRFLRPPKEEQVEYPYIGFRRMTESEVRESQSQAQGDQARVSINMPSSASLSVEPTNKHQLSPASIRTTGTQDTSMEGDDDVFLPNGNGHIYHERAAFLFNTKVQAGSRPPKHQRSAAVMRRRSRILCVLAVVTIVLGLSLGIGLYFGLRGDISLTSPLKTYNVSGQVAPPHGTAGQATVPKLPVLKSLRSVWEPGDSRLFEAEFKNGTILKAFGHKTNDGSVASFFSVSVNDGHGSESVVRFPGKRSFASVLLSDGHIVNFDWASNFVNLECKVLRKLQAHVAKRSGGGGGGGGRGEKSQEPLFYVQSVPLGKFSSMFRELSTVIAGTFHWTPDSPDGSSAGNGTSSACPPRVPLRVTKCGAQYAYEDAFLQGEVTYEGEQPISVAALPWLQETDRCGEPGGNTPPNYYLPLSRGRQPAPGAHRPFCTSASRAFARLCTVMSHTTRSAVKEMCRSIALRVVGSSGYSTIASIVEESCHEIYNSLRLVCLVLTGQDLKEEKADPKHPVLLEGTIKTKLCNQALLLMPPKQRSSVNLRIIAFCPAADPKASFEQTLDLREKNGTSFLKSLVHINCLGSPEVTYVFLGHAYTGATTSSLMQDRVKHRLQVCSMCAYGMTLAVKVQEDSVCCNDTCARDRKCVMRAQEPPREEMTFTEHNSVYCHDFLLDYERKAHQTPASCVGDCHSLLEVNLQMEDTRQGLLYYDQKLGCEETKGSSCKKVIGT